MAQKGLTRNQFRIQMGLVVIWELYAVFQIVLGIQEGRTSRWIMGTALALVYAAFAGYLIYLRYRHPVDDEQLEKQVGKDFKAGMTGFGIVLGLITAGFLIAFGLVALLR